MFSIVTADELLMKTLSHPTQKLGFANKQQIEALSVSRVFDALLLDTKVQSAGGARADPPFRQGTRKESARPAANMGYESFAFVLISGL